jgi:hypothetical protein
MGNIPWWFHFVILASVLLMFFIPAWIVAFIHRRIKVRNPHLYPCPDCKRMVSQQAVTCPECGKPLQQIRVYERQEDHGEH